MGSKPSVPPQVSYALSYPVNRGQRYLVQYINLDKRTDRRAEVEKELKLAKLKPFARFPAIVNKIGMIGCGQSHAACVKQGIESGADHILIFEDDFYFTMDPSKVHELLQTVIQTNYDVFLLGYCVEDQVKNTCGTNVPLLKKINRAQCCHGYMVSKQYAPKLLENFEKGVELLIKTKDLPKYSCDQYWKLLQDNDMWLCPSAGPCGLQRAGYSDIDRKNKNGSITDIKMSQ